MRHVVGDVEEKGATARLTDKTQGLVRVTLGQGVRLDGPLDLLQATVERNGRSILHERQPVVVRIRQSEKIVESMFGRIELRTARKVTEVPLAEHPGSIPLGPQRLSDRDLVARESDR